MRRITIALIALLFALIAAPASAQDEMEMVMYTNPITQDVYVVGELDAGDPATARMMVTLADDQFVEDNFGGQVLQSETLNPVALQDVNADTGKMYGVQMDDGFAILTVLAVDSNVYMFSMLGPNLDTDVATEYIRNVTTYGIDAPPPAGFVEVDPNNPGVIGG